MPVDDSANVSSAMVDEMAREALALLGTRQQVPPFSSRFPSLGLADAYRVAEKVRRTREGHGEKVVGRKIGFTNRKAWSAYGVSAPIWGYMFDTTVKDLVQNSGSFSAAALPEPRIEPEIVLHLARTPAPHLSERELLGCIDWIAHGFEIVSSIFPGWRFTAADVVAAYGAHASLLIGDRHPVADSPDEWSQTLPSFRVELASDDALKSGHGRNVLDGPLTALRILSETIAEHPECPPLRAGEIVTTGTLTDPMPIDGGQVWTTRLTGIALEGLRLSIQ